MAAMGPILPQLSVYGKEMGVSSVVMGSVTGILPLAFLVAKPIFGIIVDVYRKYRKAIFMAIIVTMGLSYAMLYFIPPRIIHTFDFNTECSQLDTCNVTTLDHRACDAVHGVSCHCRSHPEIKINGFVGVNVNGNDTEIEEIALCSEKKLQFCNQTCDIKCLEDVEIHSTCLYATWNFWFFIILLCVGTICFNVANSLSDAICCDIIGDDYEYGKQRVWGTIGFGLAAAISGVAVEHWSNEAISYRPAIICMLIFVVFDIVACVKLELPVIESPKNIFKDLMKLLGNRFTAVFLTFSVFAGVVDGFIIYFLFWYLEDLALITHTTNVKLLEGLIVAAETLGGEVVFFYISGLILERFGHVRTFSMCFLFYALRLGLISIVPSPWWLLLTEFLLQGPTYALTYATIVAYAHELAPVGMSATMQGLAAGMDDGFGYALGSFFGGVLYNILHVVIHMKFLRDEFEDDMDDKYGAYDIPTETTDNARPRVETIHEEDEEHGETGVMLKRLA
ncbi:MFS_1 like family [Popillia japonica]|uniref:MFS_1 like family n=1 Tax=Popillia japonica TaxID=7064 RepID=A0AAW1KNN2_POPJA